MCNDKIPKNNLIAAIHQQRNTSQERICEKRKRTAGIMSSPDLDFSWLRVKVCPDSILKSQTTFLIFNGSLCTKFSWNPTGGNTLSLGGPERHTKGPAKSQVHETTTVLYKPIQNICPFINFYVKSSRKSCVLWHGTFGSWAPADRPSHPNDYMRHLNWRNKSNHKAAASDAYFVLSWEMFAAEKEHWLL